MPGQGRDGRFLDARIRVARQFQQHFDRLARSDVAQHFCGRPPDDVVGVAGHHQQSVGDFFVQLEGQREFAVVLLKMHFRAQWICLCTETNPARFST